MYKTLTWTPPDYDTINKGDLLKIASHLLIEGVITCSDEKVLFLYNGTMVSRTVNEICRVLIK